MKSNLFCPLWIIVFDICLKTVSHYEFFFLYFFQQAYSLHIHQWSLECLCTHGVRE